MTMYKIHRIRDRILLVVAVIFATVMVTLAVQSAFAAEPEANAVSGTTHETLVVLEPTPTPVADRISSRLSASSESVTVESMSTIPVEVTVATETGVVSQAVFVLNPGEVRDLSVTEALSGTVSAAFRVLSDAPIAGDSASVTLQVEVP